jgi:hypothetical protein
LLYVPIIAPLAVALGTLYFSGAIKVPSVQKNIQYSGSDGKGSAVLIEGFEDPDIVCSQASQTKSMLYTGNFNGQRIEGTLNFRCDKTPDYDAIGTFTDTVNKDINQKTCSGSVEYLLLGKMIIWDYKKCLGVKMEISTKAKNNPN